MIKKMAVKVLIVEKHEWEDGDKGLTMLIGDPKDETLYAEYQSNVDGKITYDTLELAVNIKEMIKIRDYLTKLINKTAKGYPYPKSLTDYYGNTYEVTMEGEEVYCPAEYDIMEGE